MHICRVGHAKLPILVEARREDFTRFRQEQGVELSRCDLLESLPLEVWLVVLGRLDAIGDLVPVEYLTVLRVVVPVLAELEARVFTQAKRSTLVIDEQLVLET